MAKYKYVDGVKYRVLPQSVLGYALVREDSDSSLPAGGTEGQVLGKASDADYDVEWTDIPEGAVIIDATLVMSPPHDLPGNYDTVLTTDESLSEIGSKLEDSPVYLKVDLGAMAEGVTLVGYYPLYNYTDYPGIYTGITGGFIGASAQGSDQLQTITGFEYNDVTYFGLRDVNLSTPADNLPRSFVMEVVMTESSDTISLALQIPEKSETYNTLIFNNWYPVIELYVPQSVSGNADTIEYYPGVGRRYGSEYVTFDTTYGTIKYNYRTSTFTIEVD